MTSERDWQEVVIDLARLYGWLCHHCRAALNQRGRYSVPIQGDPGFPDLVLARGGRVIFAELKRDSGRLTPYQAAWRNAISRGPVEWYCWRPEDLELVQRCLAYPQTEWREVRTVDAGGKL